MTNTVTVNSGGTLGGNGQVGGAVVLNSGSALSPANNLNTINTLTISNNLTMNGAVTCFFDVNKDSLAADQVAGVSNINYSGSLVVTNIGAAGFAGAETFQLFTASGTKSGNFTSVTILPNTGATGSFNPATGMLTISAVPTTPTNLIFSVSRQHPDSQLAGQLPGLEAAGADQRRGFGNKLGDGCRGPKV